MGDFVRDILKLNRGQPQLPRIFGPDETAIQSSDMRRLKSTNRDWQCRDFDELDEVLAQDGRIMDAYAQSEHMCEGWLEGYLLTGRHGFFASYEAFIRIVDSMVCHSTQSG